MTLYMLGGMVLYLWSKIYYLPTPYNVYGAGKALMDAIKYDS